MCDCDCELPKRERWKLVKDEALREAAEKIRSRGAAHLAFGRASWPFHEAADLIDPDKES